MIINKTKYLPNIGKYLIHRWQKPQPNIMEGDPWNVQISKRWELSKASSKILKEFLHTPMHYPLETSYDSIVDEPQLSYQGSKLVTYDVNPLIFPLHYLGKWVSR